MTERCITHSQIPQAEGKGAVMSDGDTSECGGTVSKVSLVLRCKWKIHSGMILCKAETFWDFESNRKCFSRYAGDKGRVWKPWHVENKEVIGGQIRRS